MSSRSLQTIVNFDSLQVHVSGGEELKEVPASEIFKILQKMIEDHLLVWNLEVIIYVWKYLLLGRILKAYCL